jgi:hypothetical protein
VGVPASGPLSCAQYQQIKAIADFLVAPLRGKDLTTQVNGVMDVLAQYLRGMQFTYSETAPHYADPYGFLVLFRASCAGDARTGGLLLSELGSPWTHVNANLWAHQWVDVTIDGTTVPVDPYILTMLTNWG